MIVPAINITDAASNYLIDVQQLIDVSWATVHLRCRTMKMEDIIQFLAQSSPEEVANCLNPLVDLNYIWQQHLRSARGLSALDVIVQYNRRLVSRGLTPHPLIDHRIWAVCRAREGRHDPAIHRTKWVRSLLKEPDPSGHIIFPFMHSDFILEQAGFSSRELNNIGARSLSRFYLGFCAPKGYLPHPRFDPLFLHAQRTGETLFLNNTANIGRFLIAELSAYVAQACRNGTMSPSSLFDEGYMRIRPAIRKAIRDRRYVNAFHAYVANERELSTLTCTRSGVDFFARFVTSRTWWKRDKNVTKNATLEDNNDYFFRRDRHRLCRSLDRTFLIHIDGDIPTSIKAGQYLTLIIHGYVLGSVFPDKIDVRVGRRVFAGSFQGYPRPDISRATGIMLPFARRMYCGFAAIWHGRVNRVGKLPVSVRVRGRPQTGPKRPTWQYIGAIRAEAPRVRLHTGIPARLAIAMATYEPDPRLFNAQVNSILSQTFGDWQLLISDESESDNARENVRLAAARDPRIRVLQGPRLGFVGNFERALSHLDRRSTYFALSDQDDVWYPNKIERLVDCIESRQAVLAYGGMRIVTEGGAVLEDSFFSWRQRHNDTTPELLTVNTVTGSACLARTFLLPEVLPIPRFGLTFHDMWIALVASQRGTIVFSDDILQDYVQHDRNVIGHSGKLDRRIARKLKREERVFLERTNRPLPFRDNVTAEDAQVLSSLSGCYLECLHREFLASALKGRFQQSLDADPLSPDMVSVAMAARSRITTRRTERRFLNLPGWLAAGARLMHRVTSGTHDEGPVSWI